MSPEIPSFGVSFVGKEFTWSHVTEDGQVVEDKFRARSGISFDEVLEFRTIQAELQMSSQMLSRTLNRRADALDGAEAEKRPIEEIQAELDELSRKTQDFERQRWERILDQTVVLVHPPHREGLRSLLAQSSFDNVIALRNWLSDEVLGRPEAQTEAVGGVDPTLPPPQPSSPSSETGGQDSEPEESSSTD